MAEALALATKLSQLASQSSSKDATNTDSLWKDVEGTAQSLADILRTPSETHTNVGNTSLPVDLTGLIKASRPATDESSIPIQASAPALFQIFRVGANICMDHDGNRKHLLEADLLSAILSILSAYSNTRPDKLNVDDFKVIKTGVGVLLNASVGYEPVRTKLVADHAPQIVLKLISTLYPPGAWSTAPPEDSSEEEWKWRHELSTWGWRALETFREKDGGASIEAIFTPDDVSYLISPLKAFTPPFPKTTTFPSDAALRKALINADLESLGEVSMHLESLALDVESVRTSLGQAPSPNPTNPSSNSLKCMLTFVEEGVTPSVYLIGELEIDQVKKYDKTVGTCKAAVIKTVVEVAGEDKNMEPMWGGRAEGDGKVSVPEGWFVNQMLNWIRKPRDENSRDDLVICASLSLGNLARKESHCLGLVREPISIVKDLLPFLTPKTDIKLKHGVISLLKHLSQSPQNRTALGEAGVIEKLAGSKIWDESQDMAQIVQVSAIAVAKHLCTGSVSNTLRLSLPLPNASSDQGPTGIEQIFDIIRRSDTLVLQSEATRVLVNVIKSLWSPPAEGETVDDARRKAAIEVVSNEETADALAELIGRNRKYPVLLNEGVVALTLLASHQATGTSIVLNALVSPLTAEGSSAPSQPSQAPQSQSQSQAQAQSQVASATSGLDMLATILSNKEGNLPPELRANVCSLLMNLDQGQDNEGVSKEKLGQMKDATKPILQEIVAAATAVAASGPSENIKQGDKLVIAAAKRVLESFN